jgi:hypothetical protein
MVAWTRLNVTLYVHWLAVLFLAAHNNQYITANQPPRFRPRPLWHSEPKQELKNVALFFQIFSIANATAWWEQKPACPVAESIDTCFSNSHKTDRNCCHAVGSIWRTHVSTDSRSLQMKLKFDNTLKNSLHVSAPPRCITPWTKAGLLSRDSWIQYHIFQAKLHRLQLLSGPLISVCGTTKSGASHGNHLHKRECGVSARLSGEPTLPLLSTVFKYTFKRK